MRWRVAVIVLSPTNVNDNAASASVSEAKASIESMKPSRLYRHTPLYSSILILCPSPSLNSHSVNPPRSASPTTFASAAAPYTESAASTETCCEASA